MLKDSARKLQSPRVDDGHGGIPYTSEDMNFNKMLELHSQGSCELLHQPVSQHKLSIAFRKNESARDHVGKVTIYPSHCRKRLCSSQYRAPP